MIVDELIAILGFDLKGEGELKQFKDGIKSAEKAAEGAAGDMDKLGSATATAMASARPAVTGLASDMNRLAVAIGGALAGLQVMDWGRQFVGQLTSVNAQFEAYEATLRTITGSPEQAATAMDWISDFARKTPYEAAQVTEAFVRMKAYGLDPMNGSLRTIGDASSAMGKTIMDGVEAIADAVTGENERLKEFGITSSVAGDKITYTWTQNGKKLTKTVKKDALEIQAAIMEIFGRFDGAMDEQSRTWNGLTSNLKENWTDLLRAIGDAGYFEDAKRRLRGLLDYLEAKWSDGTFGAIAKRISDGLIRGMDVATHLGTQAYRIGRGFYFAADALADLISRMTGLPKALAGLGLGAGALATNKYGRAALVGLAKRFPAIAAFLVVDDLMSALAGDESVIGSTPGGKEAIEALRASVTEIKAAAESAADSIGKLFGVTRGEGESSIGALGKAAGTWIAELMVLRVQQIAAAIESIAAALTVLKDVIEDPSEAFKRLADAAIAQIDRIVAAIDEATGGIFNLTGGDRTTMAGKGGAVRPAGTDRGGAAAEATRNGKKPVKAGIFGHIPGPLDVLDRLLSGSGESNAEDRIAQAEEVTGDRAVREIVETRPEVEIPYNSQSADIAGWMRRQAEAGAQPRYRPPPVVYPPAPPSAPAFDLSAFAQTVMQKVSGMMAGFGPAGANGLEMMAKLTLDASGFDGPLGAAQSAISSIARDHQARITLDISNVEAQAARATALINAIPKTPGGTSGVGRSAVAPRAAVAASPSG